MSVQHAKDLAERIAIQEFGFSEPPVNVRKIAKKYGLQIIEEPLENGVAGLLITQGAQSFCVLNQSDGLNRQRFTIGHELGHLILKHQEQVGDHVHVDKGNFISMRGPRATQGVDSKEIEANQFSACLLMPEAMIHKIVKQVGEPLTDDKVMDLAERFQVSEQAMTIRLNNLNYI